MSSKQDRLNELIDSSIKVFGDTPQARLAVTQAILESNYLNDPSELASKHFNLFGIKGKGTAGSVKLPTTEVVNGQSISTTASFAKNKSILDSFKQYKDILENHVKSVLSASNPKEAIQDVAKSGYATDPKYGQKLASIFTNQVKGQGDFKPTSATKDMVPNQGNQPLKPGQESITNKDNPYSWPHTGSDGVYRPDQLKGDVSPIPTDTGGYNNGKTKMMNVSENATSFSQTLNNLMTKLQSAPGSEQRKDIQPIKDKNGNTLFYKPSNEGTSEDPIPLSSLADPSSQNFDLTYVMSGGQLGPQTLAGTVFTTPGGAQIMHLDTGIFMKNEGLVPVGIDSGSEADQYLQAQHDINLKQQEEQQTAIDENRAFINS